MKRIVAIIGMALLFLASPAGAQPYKGGRFPPPDQDRRMPPPQRPVDDRRDAREDRGRFDRMSPEERRKLREDIGHHGREIYRDRKGGKR